MALPEIRRIAADLSLRSKLYQAEWKRSSAQLAVTLSLFLVGLAAMYAVSGVSRLCGLLVAIPVAGLLVRLFIFQHDCGHGSFFRSRRANDAVGRMLGVLTLTPYGAWKMDHAAHHASSGDLDRRGQGDVTTLTVGEYRDLAPLGRLGYRLYRSPFIMVLLGAPTNFILLQRFVVGQSFRSRGSWSSILSLNIAIVAAYGSAMVAVGVGPVLAVYLPVMIIASWIGNWLFYVQHQFEGAYWERKADWNFQAAALQGGSYFKLPAMLQWFSGNIGLHHVHHLCSRIPNYHLQSCLDSMPELEAMSPTVTLGQSFACWRLALWSEREGRMVGFSELKQA